MFCERPPWSLWLRGGNAQVQRPTVCWERGGMGGGLGESWFSPGFGFVCESLAESAKRQDISRLISNAFVNPCTHLTLVLFTRGVD
jgi:hypothetical protein